MQQSNGRGRINRVLLGAALASAFTLQFGASAGRQRIGAGAGSDPR